MVRGMKDSKSYNLLAGATLILSAGLVIATAAGLLVDFGSLSVRLGLLGAGFALAGTVAALTAHRARKNHRAVQRHFDALCELDVCHLSLDGPGDAPPPLPADNPWSEISGRVLKVLQECGRRTQELKHTRTAWKVRCRRAATRHEQIKAVFSGLADPILAVDDYDELTLANRSAEELFRFDGENVESRALAQLVHCERLVNLLKTTSRHRTSGTRTDEIEIVDEDGRSRWYRATASKLPAGEEEGDGAESSSEATSSAGAVAVLRDIGDQKALQKRNAEFVSAVSHEMKTPLSGIKAYVELLVDGDAEDDETREEFLGVINGQADRLQRLIDNMLNLARIEAGVVNVSKQTQSLNELLEEAVHVVQPSAEAKQIELVTELSPMYLGVLADRDMLLQSAINLLSNAIKYTPAEGRVVLRSRLEDDHLKFEVQDTGVGLDEEDCRRVFEKFYRVNKSKDMASGTGLGLPLAKHIVEDVHGGRLSAESTLGQGSTFTVTLPGAGQLT